MIFTQEWFSHCSQRQGLRTSTPKGAQKSTYFLSLPAQYSIPLMIAFGFLHWLVSQSLFVVNVELSTAWGEPDYTSPGANRPSTPYVWTIGWAWFPMFLILVLCCLLFVVLLGIGFRRYNSEGMPLARTSSKAISAACHPIQDRCTEGLQKIQYGVTGKIDYGRERVGFSSTAVKPLVEGGQYYRMQVTDGTG